MFIGTIIITLHAPWVSSLKEKRMIVKSICAKVGNKFNVSIAEIDEQDIHKTLVLGIACVANEVNQADRILDQVINFIESSNEAEIIDIDREVL